jgi:hypothetical protein
LSAAECHPTGLFNAAGSSWPLTANMVGHSHSVGFYENSYAEIDGSATGVITSTKADVIQLMLRFATDRLFARKNNTGTWQVMNWTGTTIVGNPIFAAVAIDDPWRAVIRGFCRRRPDLCGSGADGSERE